MIIQKRVGIYIVEGEQEKLERYEFPEQYYEDMDWLERTFPTQTFSNYLVDMKDMQRQYLNEAGFRIVMEAQLRRELKALL